MVREIIKPKDNEYTIKIPAEYINRRIEILILPYPEDDSIAPHNSGVDIIKKTAGLLAGKNIDPVEWQRKMRSEWDREK